MNKLLFILPLCLLALILTSCEKQMVTPSPSTPAAMKSSPFLRATIVPDRRAPRTLSLLANLESEEKIDMLCRKVRTPGPYPNEQVTLDGLNMNDGCLEIECSYSGGCEMHLFALTWNGNYTNSQQNEVVMNLSHYGNGDFCEGWITKTRSWDMSVLDPPGRTSGTINVIINAWNGQSMSINYTY